MFYFEGNTQRVNHASRVPESSLILDGTVSLDLMDEKLDVVRDKSIIQSIIQFLKNLI